MLDRRTLGRVVVPIHRLLRRHVAMIVEREQRGQVDYGKRRYTNPVRRRAPAVVLFIRKRRL